MPRVITIQVTFKAEHSNTLHIGLWNTEFLPKLANKLGIVSIMQAFFIMFISQILASMLLGCSRVRSLNLYGLISPCGYVGQIIVQSIFVEEIKLDCLILLRSVVNLG